MIRNFKFTSAIFILFFLTSLASYGQIKLPKLVSDGMVLQRDSKVRIWGWASANEKITIHFINSTYNASANSNGEWEVYISNLKAGGPYVMQIDGSNSIKINDILVGDVWVCSGQSNMGFGLGQLMNVYPDEFKNLDNPNIRQFSVPVATNFNDREKDYKSGKWQAVDSKSARFFTAVGYFFAKNLYAKYKIPIGLINANLGGSSAEAWISEESIKSFPKYYEDLQRFQKPGYLEKINKQDEERVTNWYKQIKQNDEGYKDPQNNWFNPSINTSDWAEMYVPGYWADSKAGNVNGVVWFRKEINIPSETAGKAATLKLGRIADADSVYINGKFVGSMGSQYAPRNYKIPAGLLKAGENTIVVRIISCIRHGGFVPGKEYQIESDGKTFNLEGTWKYKIGTAAEPLEDRLFTGKIPSGLFNSMVAPMLNYSIKGAVWYQGESNTFRAFEHYDLFKLLINDWRSSWHQGNFPFLYVQLPNFVEVNVEATKYDWAILRESQLKALAIPNTGMAVTVDIGEYNDIHPVNKVDVGYRLALAAEKVAYGEKNIVYSGPIYKSMKVKGNKVILSFTNTGSGLFAKNNSELKCFEICGTDNKYYPAKAKIENGNVVVWSPEVNSPAAVRYAWANNPEGANLYNKEGLPASPFRTSELY